MHKEWMAEEARWSLQFAIDWLRRCWRVLGLGVAFELLRDAQGSIGPTRHSLLRQASAYLGGAYELCRDRRDIQSTDAIRTLVNNVLFVEGA